MRAPEKSRYLSAVRRIESEEISFQEDEIEVSIAGKILNRSLLLTPSTSKELETSYDTGYTFFN